MWLIVINTYPALVFYYYYYLRNDYIQQDIIFFLTLIRFSPPQQVTPYNYRYWMIVEWLMTWIMYSFSTRYNCKIICRAWVPCLLVLFSDSCKLANSSTFKVCKHEPDYGNSVVLLAFSIAKIILYIFLFFLGERTEYCVSIIGFHWH